MSSPDVRQSRSTVRQSIRSRLLVLLLGLSTISVLTVGYLAVDSVRSAGQSAQQVSREALRAQAEEYLRQVTVGDAQKNDFILKQVQNDAENVAQYAAAVFEEPGVFAGGAYWEAEDHMFVAADGQYMNDETDVSSAFVPYSVDIDEEVLAVLNLSAYLDLVFEPTFERDANTVAIYLGTREEVVRYYPNINLGAVIPADFRVTRRPWYEGANPRNNPERMVIWSEVYVDATGKGLMVTAAAPVYVYGERFVGVVGIDVTLEDISASIAETRLLGSGYSLLVDDQGGAIVLPEQGYRDILGRDPGPNELGVDLSEAWVEFKPVLGRMTEGVAGFDSLQVGGRELFVAYAPLESTGWSLANVIEAETVLQAVETLQGELQSSTRSLVLTRILPVGGAILAAMAVLGLLLGRRFAEPIRRIAAAAERIGAGEWDAPLPAAGNDEVGVLSRTFSTMTGRLRELMEGLEQRVEERTADLERRSVQLEAAAEVARAAAALMDLRELLSGVVTLVSERFGFYHAGIFLLDPSGEWAVLQAASSEGGRRMLTRRHRLRVGVEGIVGYVTGQGEPRIALDVGEDAVFFDNPDLPETRSEMALPLRARGAIIGALDVQSKEPAAFTEEDLAVLQTLADQVAMAISNARLFERVEESLEVERRAYGQLSREAWQQRLRVRPGLGYRYDESGVGPLDEQLRSQAKDHGRRSKLPELEFPVRLRGNVIATISAHKPAEAGDWTPEETALMQMLADQLGMALESARLYEDAQRRATRERLTREITDKMRSVTDVEEIVQAAVDELFSALGTSRAFVRLGTPSRLAQTQPLDPSRVPPAADLWDDGKDGS